MTYPILGLMGRARSGKDTFAARLVADHGYTRIAFADPLREAALALDPIVSPDAERPSQPRPEVWRYSEALDTFGYERAKDMFPEFRRILQRLGTDSIRALDDGFWVRIGIERIRAAAEVGPVVVTDVRFPNEADALHTIGGDLVRLVRGLDTTPTEDLHPSETALDAYHEDFKVLNHDTVAHLGEQADRIAHHLQHHATL